MEMFVRQYLVRFNATRAYMDSHPKASWATANSEGSKLLADPRISKEITRGVADLTARYQQTAQRTLEAIALIAYSCITDAFDGSGALLPPEKMPRETAAAIKRIVRIEILGTDPNGNSTVVGHTVKIELHDKLAALRLLGQHYGLFQNQQESANDDLLLRALEQGAARDLATVIKQQPLLES